MILSVNKLNKSFKQGDTDIKAVQDISFELNPGETLAIVGSSGSGKTTLLSLLTGLDNADSGEIIMVDQKITELSERQLSLFRAQNIGIVFQEFHLMPHLTAAENVALPLEIAHQSDVDSQVTAALKKVGLSERHDHLPHQLSGGECQRVAIARAMVAKPRILFADEPSGNLDTDTGQKVMDLLFSLVEENKMTMILVTHEKNLAQRCLRQIEMAGGKAQ